jgi:hypothetical protein
MCKRAEASSGPTRWPSGIRLSEGQSTVTAGSIRGSFKAVTAPVVQEEREFFVAVVKEATGPRLIEFAPRIQAQVNDARLTCTRTRAVLWIERVIVDIQHAHTLGIEHFLADQSHDTQEQVLTVGLYQELILASSSDLIAQYLAEPRLQPWMKVNLGLLDADQGLLPEMHLDDDGQDL